MPRKKINWELEWFKIHNPPEQFYFKFSKTTLYSDQLFKTPSVSSNAVLSKKIIDIIFEWEDDNNISKEKSLEWVHIIRPILDLIQLSRSKRKELFKYYKETQQVKLEQSIDAISKAESILYNDALRLPHLVEQLKIYKAIYNLALDYFLKRESGENQLLYDLIIPLKEKMEKENFSKYRVKNCIDDLLERFDFDSKSVGQSIYKYTTKPYFPKKILKKIDDITSNSDNSIHSLINSQLIK